MLSIIESHLKLDKVSYTSITGAVPTKERLIFLFFICKLIV